MPMLGKVQSLFTGLSFHFTWDLGLVLTLDPQDELGNSFGVLSFQQQRHAG